MLFLTPFYLQYLTSVSLFVSLVPYFPTDDRNKKINSGFSIIFFIKYTVLHVKQVTYFRDVCGVLHPIYSYIKNNKAQYPSLNKRGTFYKMISLNSCFMTNWHVKAREG